MLSDLSDSWVVDTDCADFRFSFVLIREICVYIYERDGLDKDHKLLCVGDISQAHLAVDRFQFQLSQNVGQLKSSSQ